MTPTPLAALPSNQPIPNGRVVNLRTQNASMTLSSSGPTLLVAGPPNGGLQVNIQPTYNCFLVAKANFLVQGSPGASGGVWNRCDFAMQISPADADGRTREGQCPTETYDGNTVPWATWQVAAMFRLTGGTFYQVGVYCVYLSGNKVAYLSGPSYTRLLVYTVGEGLP